MPIQGIPGKPTFREQLTSFNGVNLRDDATKLGEGQLSSGIDIDLYESTGSILSRRGFTPRYTLLDSPARKIIRGLESSIHAAGTTLYQNGVGIGNILVSSQAVDMIEFRGSSSPIAEIFIANGPVDSETGFGGMRRLGADLGLWGITAPTSTPGASLNSGGALTGTYSIKFTYVRKSGDTLVHESNPSVKSDDVALTADDLDYSVLGSLEAGVTHIRIYRTLAGGSTYLFEVEIPNAAGANTGTLATIDGGLGALVSEDNNRPEPATIVHALRDRIWTNDSAQGNRLRYTDRFLPERQPSANFIDIGGENHTITAITSIDSALIVYTESTKFRIIEQLPDVGAIGGGVRLVTSSSAGFVALELHSSRGTRASEAVVSTGFGIIYPSKEGLFLSSAGTGPEQLLSQKIQSIFIGTTEGGIPPIDFNFESNMIAGFHRGRYYLSYTSTTSIDEVNDITAILDIATGEWYFWNEGFTAFYFDDEDNLFFGGRNDGDIEVLEDPSVFSDGSAMTAITSTFSTASSDGGDSLSQKLFLYARVDAEVAAGDTLTASFYANETLKKTFTITGNRARSLLRLPSGSRGYTWRMEFSFTGTSRVKVHGVEAQWKGLTSS